MEHEGLILLKDGSIEDSRWVYDDEKEEGEYVNIPYEKYIKTFTNTEVDNHLLANLDKKVKLEDGYTLRNYFSMVTKYKSLQNLDSYFSDFLEEVNKAPTSGCNCKSGEERDIEFLEIYKYVCYETYSDEWVDTFIPKPVDNELKEKGLTDWEEENGFKHKLAQNILKRKKAGTWESTPPSIDDYWAFHGLGYKLTKEQSESKDNHMKLKEGERIPWAIEFCPIDQLLDLPIIIGDTQIHICPEDSDVSKWKSYKAEGSISLYNFVKYIIWELSFCGTPNQRDGKRDDLDKRCEEIKDITDEMDKEKLE